MVNHPNRNWRSRWTVDLSTGIATHRDGWRFRFAISDDSPNAIDGECIAQPTPLTPEHMREAPRIAREAGDAYVEARRVRN